MAWRIGAASAASLLALALAAGPALSAESPKRSACPHALPAGTSCYVGEDTLGAYYFIAIPEGWNHVVLTASASQGEGIEAVVDALEKHHAWLGRRRLGQQRAGFGGLANHAHSQLLLQKKPQRRAHLCLLISQQNVHIFTSFDK